MKDSMFKSNILKYIYNEYDFFFRFAYCKLPIIRTLLQRIMFWRMYSSVFRHMDDIFLEINDDINKYGFNLEDKKIIELGPGNSIILALNCLRKGAKKYQMVDKYPRILKTEMQRKNLLEQVTYFENKYNCDTSNLVSKDDLEFNNTSLSYIKNSTENLKEVPSSSIDVILSISVFEHVKDVETSFQEIKRVLKKGGIMYHRIDLRDHYNFNKPFKFLKYSDYVWDNFLTKEGFSYTNRLRVDDFEYLLRKYNFEVLNINKDDYNAASSKMKLDEKFRNKKMDDLRTVVITFLAKNEFN